MELKTGRFGPYFACNKCDNTRKVLKKTSGSPAPPRMDPIDMPQLKSTKHDDHFILREGAAGLFLAASKFPKVRETRPPKLAGGTRPFRIRMDDRFQYLLVRRSGRKIRSVTRRFYVGHVSKKSSILAQRA